MATPTVTRTITDKAPTEHRIYVTSTGGVGNVSTIAQVYTAVVAMYPTAMSYDSGTMAVGLTSIKEILHING